MAQKRKTDTVGYEQQETFKPQSPEEKHLAQAFTKLKDDKEILSFLRDLLTLSEIKEFSSRLEMARLLKAGHSYQEVADMLKVSTTTVTRTAHWLFHGCGGYQKVLSR
jgi:TrpR-related protein YerC/YecD